jgi:hypothetical protein
VERCHATLARPHALLASVSPHNQRAAEGRAAETSVTRSATAWRLSAVACHPRIDGTVSFSGLGQDEGNEEAGHCDQP